MYRAHDLWEEALRVAKANGTKKELGEVAIKIAERMGTERGTQFLIKNGLIEAAIDFEANQEKFDDAFKLAENHARYKLPDVHLKYALHLEDDNRFKEAEEEFIKANKPQEAINMYEHKGDWHSAIQVARQYHPESVTRVQLKQAVSYQQKNDFTKAEQCFLAAKEPEKAISMY
jgi:intraflagellar transport protein 172